MSDLSQPDARVGKYRILSHVATGGMGTVYKAMDEELGRIVALKVLAPDNADNVIILERFRREARHAARLSHRNIVTLYECGEADGYHFLAMEFVQGIDLGEYIARRGKLPAEEARRILIQATKALDHAFSHGIIHRDIKPSNFLLTKEDGRSVVKLTDMGLARTVNEEEFRVTRAGTTVGTVDYLSPEQARDSSLADVRSDIYSLGCTFYHMLAGAPPFGDGGLGERIYKHLAAEPHDVRENNPSVTYGVWMVLKRMLAKNPEQRYQTPAELLADLKHPPREPKKSAAQSDTVQDLGTPTPAPEQSAGQPAADAGAAKEKRRSTTPDSFGLPADRPEVLGVSFEQRQAAAGQFERAEEVLRNGGDRSYALQLLLSCCRLDPTNLTYRKKLREVGRPLAGEAKGGWLAGLSLDRLASRHKFRAACRAGENRKVLDLGEELLARYPDDIGVQLEMAEAAEDLRLVGLALWILDQARRNEKKGTAAHRAMAMLFERLKLFPQAMALWEIIRRLSPNDPLVEDKIRELAVSDTLARSNIPR
jgi:serine/threonine protein kinase